MFELKMNVFNYFIWIYTDWNIKEVEAARVLRLRKIAVTQQMEYVNNRYRFVLFGIKNII